MEAIWVTFISTVVAVLGLAILLPVFRLIGKLTPKPPKKLY